jgi:hypothetical protein
VSLREVEPPAGPPWGLPLAGTLDELVVESELLADNPLGDPARRPLYVYTPPGVEPGQAALLPSIYVIQGYYGRVDSWLHRPPFEPSMVERVDALYAGEAACPDAIVVFVDAWTAYGGSQYVDSIATGPYQSYLCDEVIPFVDARYPTAPEPERRGISGKSSGGYGAMVVPMMRPDCFSALASHAGDALFELCHVPFFGEVVRTLRDHFDGSFDVFFERIGKLERFDMDRLGGPLMEYGCAAAYTPDPDRPGKALLPFDIETGRLVDEVWERYLEWDPVRMAAGRADELRSLRYVYLDGGRSDEWYLDLGAQAFGKELGKLGVDHELELFDGKHGGIAYRYPEAIRRMVTALSR